MSFDRDDSTPRHRIDSREHRSKRPEHNPDAFMVLLTSCRHKSSLQRPTHLSNDYDNVGMSDLTQNRAMYPCEMLVSSVSATIRYQTGLAQPIHEPCLHDCPRLTMHTTSSAPSLLQSSPTTLLPFCATPSTCLETRSLQGGGGGG
jgi:hypothetical protein